MSKGIFFSLGLLSGGYISINLRDQGFTKELTKNYYRNTNDNIQINSNYNSNINHDKTSQFPEKSKLYKINSEKEEFEKMQQTLDDEYSYNIITNEILQPTVNYKNLNNIK